jgi:anti-sigma-K factor RskA
MVHDDYKEMIPARALSALDAAEDRVMSEHLSECDECRRELAEWEATAATLALSAAPIEPSPDVRARILNQIHSDKPVLEFRPARRSVWSSLGSLGAIAAVVLFVALIVSVIVLWQQNRRLRQENEVVQFLSSPEAGVKELKGTNEAPHATAKIVFGSEGRAVLITSGLPQPPQGKEYQLWVIDPKQPPRPEKTFSTDSAGKALLKVERLFEVEREYGVFAVTLEPAGGVQSPTGAMYLRSDL